MKYFFIFITLCATGFNAIANENARALFSKGNGVTFNTQMKVELSIEQQVLSEDSGAKIQPLPVDVSKDTKNGDKSDNKKLTTDYAGFSYQLLKETSNNKYKRVSPDYEFKTGDRLVVEVMSNADGYLITGNIDILDKPRLLSLNQIKAGKSVRIPQKGALKFVKPAGTEKLVFVLSNKPVDKKSSTKYVKKCNNKTRSIIFVEDAGGQNYQLLDDKGSCKTKNKNSKTRSIIVDVEDDVGYGVVESEALETGSLLSLIINLKHS